MGVCIWVVRVLRGIGKGAPLPLPYHNTPITPTNHKPQTTQTSTKKQHHHQEFAALYRKLGKSPDLHLEYARSRPAALHRAWYAFHPTQDAFPTVCVYVFACM